MSQRSRFLATIVIATVCPKIAHAGMPSFTLTDMAEMRLQSISFFLVGFLFVALIVKVLWNSLTKDFTSLPRLSYGKSVVLMTLWGLLFLLVLTMISGARELLTPGAWKKNGLTYTLADDKDEARRLKQLAERREHLSELWSAIWKYGQQHDSQLPSSPSDFKLPAAWWQVPHGHSAKYVYLGGSLSAKRPQPIILEPQLFGDKRLVLFSNGEIRHLDEPAIAQALQPDNGR